MYFSLEIESNLPTMQTKQDLISALNKLAEELSKEESNIGSIKDQYGNTIGIWNLIT